MPLSSSLGVLRKRSEFLAVAAYRQRWVTPAFILQIGPRPADDREKFPVGYGLTASKKMIGKQAVLRNRARRRLREAVRRVFPLQAKEGMNYVLIARPAALDIDFQSLCKDLEKALQRLTFKP